MPNVTHGGTGPYTYTQGETPSDPDEGETWYATGTGDKDEGAFVYDGEAWVEQTVTSHTQLSDVEPWDHLSQGDVEDVVAALLAEGNAVSLSYDDENDELTVAVETDSIGSDEFGSVIDVPVYSFESELPEDAPEGSLAYVSSAGELFVEDGR